MGNAKVVNTAEIGLSKCQFSLLHSRSGYVADLVPVTVWHVSLLSPGEGAKKRNPENKFKQIHNVCTNIIMSPETRSTKAMRP